MEVSKLGRQRGHSEAYREGTHKECTFGCPEHSCGRTFNTGRNAQRLPSLTGEWYQVATNAEHHGNPRYAKPAACCQATELLRGVKANIPLYCEELEVATLHIVHRHVRHHIWKMEVAVCHDGGGGRVQEKREESEVDGGGHGDARRGRWGRVG